MMTEYCKHKESKHISSIKMTTGHQKINRGINFILVNIFDEQNN